MNTTKMKKKKIDKDKLCDGVFFIGFGLTFPICYVIYQLIAKYGIVIVLFLISFVLFVVGIICTIRAFCVPEKDS